MKMTTNSYEYLSFFIVLKIVRAVELVANMEPHLDFSGSGEMDFDLIQDNTLSSLYHFMFKKNKSVANIARTGQHYMSPSNEIVPLRLEESDVPMRSNCIKINIGGEQKSFNILDGILKQLFWNANNISIATANANLPDRRIVPITNKIDHFGMPTIARVLNLSKFTQNEQLMAPSLDIFAMQPDVSDMVGRSDHCIKIDMRGEQKTFTISDDTLKQLCSIMSNLVIAMANADVISCRIIPIENHSDMPRIAPVLENDIVQIEKIWHSPTFAISNDTRFDDIEHDDGSSIITSSDSEISTSTSNDYENSTSSDEESSMNGAHLWDIDAALINLYKK